MKKLLFSLATILSLGFMVNSCDIAEFPETVTVSQDFITHAAVVSFNSDASDDAAGSLFTGLDGTVVKVSGPDAALVFNIEGFKTFKIGSGKLQLILDPKADFSGNKEYKVNLEIEAAGYLSKIVPITFTKDITSASYVVSMLKLSTIPADVAVATNNSGTTTSTGVTAPVVVTAGTASNTAVVTSTVTVPTATVMRDVNNNVLTGSLKTEVVSFTPDEDNTSFFPGGLDNANVVLAGSSVPEEGLFIPAGFASVVMTVSGAEVKTFTGQKVTVKMSLPADSHNPETDKLYVVGDDIDVFSYDTDKGQWKFEATVKVQKEINNNLFVSYEVTHLSFWSFGRFRRGASVFCSNTTGRFTFNWASTVPTLAVRVSILNVVGGNLQSIAQYNCNITKSVPYVLPRFVNRAVTVRIRNAATNALLLSQNFGANGLCANPTLNLNVPQPTAPAVTLTFKGTCANSTTNWLAPVGTLLYYKPAGAAATAYKLFHTVTADNKSISSMTTSLLTVGQSYDFKCIVGTRSKENTYLIDSVNKNIEVLLSVANCAELRN